MSPQAWPGAAATQVRNWIEWCRSTWRTQPARTIAVVALLLAVVDFMRPLSVVQLGLLIVALVALSPWAERLPTIFESAELPGGLKFKFREVVKEVEAAGLLGEPSDQKGKPAYEIIYNDDPALALAGLRIALEKRLKDLARIMDHDDKRPLGDVVRGLLRGGVLSVDQYEALNDLLPLLNRAVHAEDTSKEAAEWAMSEGPKLIAGLEQRAKEIGGAPERLWGNIAPAGVATISSPLGFRQGITGRQTSEE
jgi:hypothetical protein